MLVVKWTFDELYFLLSLLFFLLLLSIVISYVFFHGCHLTNKGVYIPIN